MLCRTYSSINRQIVISYRYKYNDLRNFECMHIHRIIVAILAVLFCLTTGAQNENQTYRNPLLPSGADPFSFYKDGFYYYTNSTGDNITLWKTKSIFELNT